MQRRLARALVALVVAAGCVTAPPALAQRPIGASTTCYDIWIFLLTPGRPITICV